MVRKSCQAPQVQRVLEVRVNAEQRRQVSSSSTTIIYAIAEAAKLKAMHQIGAAKMSKAEQTDFKYA